MLFNSFEFLVFLPVVFALYWFVFSANYSIKYMNMENDTSFVSDDFFDETHLSELGAEKFTKKLNNFFEFVY